LNLALRGKSGSGSLESTTPVSDATVSSERFNEVVYATGDPVLNSPKTAGASPAASVTIGWELSVCKERQIRGNDSSHSRELVSLGWYDPLKMVFCYKA